MSFKKLWSLLWCAICVSGLAPNVMYAATASPETPVLNGIKNSGEIKVAYANERPPWNMYINGVRTGLAPDLFTVVENELRATADWTPYQFSGMIPAVISNRADIAVDQLFITPKRSKVVDFTDPLYGWADDILLNADSSDTYASLEDLENKRVGVLVGSVQYSKLSEISGINVITYQTTLSLAMDLANGRVDAGYVDPPSIGPLLKKRPDISLKFDETYKDPDTHYVAWAVKKGSAPGLLMKLNEIIGEMKGNGEMRRIVDKWLGPGIEIP